MLHDPFYKYSHLLGEPVCREKNYLLLPPPVRQKEPSAHSGGGDGHSGGGDGHGGGGGGKVKFTFVDLLAFLAANIFTGGIIAAVYQESQNRKLEEGEEVYTNSIKRLTEAFESATLNIKGKPVPVPSVETIQMKMSAQLSRDEFAVTYMLCGPRGVGKSTAMLMALKDKKKVIRVQPDPVTVENLYAALVWFASLKQTGLSNEQVARGAFKAIQEKGGEIPTLIVEVNEKCTEKQLELLLVELKKLVSEDRLVNCLIVASTSRASLLLSVTLSELRVAALLMNDPPEDVIKIFLEERFSPIIKDPSQREKLINFYVKEIGTRFLDATLLSTYIKSEWNNKPEQAREEMFLYYVNFLKKQKKGTFYELLKRFDTAGVKKEVKKQLLEGLLSGTLELSKLVEAMQISKKQFVEEMSLLRPNPLYIHPEEEWVTVGNHVTENEIKNYIKLL